jgi:hypothetical protein
MKNPLTLEQQAKLKKASSGMSRDRFNELSLGETNAIVHQIDLVLLELHQESPFAFSTYAYLDGTKNKVVFEDRKAFGISFSKYSYNPVGSI